MGTKYIHVVLVRISLTATKMPLSKNKMQREEFIHLTLLNHSPSLEEIRTETQVELEAEGRS